MDTGVESCEETDQRGIERLNQATLLFNPDAKIHVKLGQLKYDA